VRSEYPQPGVAEKPREGARLEPPQRVGPSPSPSPGVAEERAGTPALPSGIPQFAMAKPGVASGLRPTLEGLDWLKAKGYRTVLYVCNPEEDDSSDREQIEKKRGLKYVSLKVSPENLTPTLVDEFNHIVSDASNYPLFVYDKAGAVAGGLWYLHFRIVDLAPDDEARLKAGRLGLKENGDDLHKRMWIAVQKCLRKEK
jgi:protein tyrosine phosphatase (PTP) superfamily phosphohydrolase (DUF442 family)